METKNFTKKLIDLCLTGDMPTAKGKDAKESGLIIAISESTAPVCASYGSSRDMAVVINHILEQSEPIRLVLTTAVVGFAKLHPNDPYVIEMKKDLDVQ